MQSTKRRHNKYDDIKNYELVRPPSSMFDGRGAMKVAKGETVIKTNLKVDLARVQAEVGWMCITVGGAIR